MGCVPLTLTGIRRYPVKSCRGESLRSAVVEPWGLLGDRRWMVVDGAGDVITAREHPRLVLTTPRVTEGGVRLSHPDVGEIDVATPHGAELDTVRVWDDEVQAAPADAAAHQWFTRLLGEPARLVYLDDPTGRPTNPARTEPTDRVSFADGYPLLLATEESLAALNELIPGDAVPMTRFRPSVVVSGAPAWAEDGWRRIRIGAARFRVVKGCDRCVFTTIDPETAEKGKEPIATLSRHRKWDGKVWFAVNLVPDNPGVTIGVGDDVEILDEVEPNGPLR